MNKKLVALAVAGVLAAPLAQAQTANVTLYGRVNLDIEFVNGAIYNTQVVQPATCNKTTNTGGCITTNPWQYRLATNSSRSLCSICGVLRPRTIWTSRPKNRRG